jgi:metal-sulfur cluster biosynthetic enzyme
MQEVTREQVFEALKDVHDPEIPLNIVDLGLVYDAKIEPVEGTERVVVDVKMTLTTMGCGMGPVIAENARDRIRQMDRVADANVEIVWDPPWNQEMISEEGRISLGLA